MRRKTRRSCKSTLSVLLAVFLVAGLLPLSILADTITHPSSGSAPDKFVYSWDGQTVRIPSAVDNVQTDILDKISVKSAQDSNYQTVWIKEYELQSSEVNEESFWTYCSDFATAPKPDVTYSRTDIEEVAEDPKTLFFDRTEVDKTYDKTYITQHLRAILLKSDLNQVAPKALEDEVNADNPDTITGLTEGEMIAATQIAIWKLVNGVGTYAKPGAPVPPALRQMEGAITNSNVRALVDYLLGLEGVKADEIAKIETAIAKMRTADTYSVEIYCRITGEGLTHKPSNEEIKVDSVSYTVYTGGTPTTKDLDYTAVYDKERDMLKLTIANIPASVSPKIVLSNTQKDVNTVYLYQPEKGRGTSQMLVSVIKEDRPLKTEIVITPPNDLTRINLFKYWYSNAEGTKLLPNAVVKDYESVFSFTHVGILNEDGSVGKVFDNTKVIPDVTIKGSGSFDTKDVFEVGRLYKITEEKAKGGVLTGDAYTKYFRVDKNRDIIWTDKDGNDLGSAAQTGRNVTFSNIELTKTGSVRVTKTLPNGGKMNGAYYADAFAFTAAFTGADGTSVAYANESYELFTKGVKSATLKTGDNGDFTLTGDQYAVFSDLPVGSTLTITESGTGNHETQYTLDPVPEKSVEIAEGVEKSILFQNTYKLGKLRITKAFGSGSVLDWADGGRDAGKFTFTVTNDAENFSEEVELDKNKKWVEIDVPFGTYRVVETGAHREGYVHTVTATGDTGSISGTLSTAAFTNTYKTVSLKISKAFAYGAKVTQAQKTQIQGKTFTFDVYKDGVAAPVRTVTLTSGDGWEKTVTGLAPGTYKVVEQTTGTAVADLHLTARSEADGTPEDGYTSASVAVNDPATTPLFAFTNTYDYDTGDLTIRKNVDAAGDKTKKFSFTVTFSEALTNSTTLKIGNGNPVGLDSKTTVSFDMSANETAVFENIPVGTTYTVSETEEPDYTLSSMVYSDNAKLISKDNKDKVTVTNTRKTGSVTIKKEIAGYEPKYANDSFTFTVTIDGAPYNGASSKGAITGGKVTLKHNESVTISGLPAGAAVKVTETVSGPYTPSITNNGDGTVPADGNPLVFIATNTRHTGDLTVSKTVAGNLPDAQAKDLEFTFTIIGPYDYTQTITLSHGEQQKLSGLPTGSYTVTETATNVTDYTRVTTCQVDGVSSQNGTVNLTSSGNTVTYTNTYTRDTGKLQITKIIDDNSYAAQTFSFTVTFDPALPDDVARPSGDGITNTAFTNGRKTLTFDMVGGVTATITGIPTGTTYTVTETPDENYTMQSMVYSNINQTITKGVTDTVTVTNTRNMGYLKITKNFLIEAVGTLDKSGTVTLTLTNKDTNEIYTRAVTVTDGTGTMTETLPLGTYTITEAVFAIDGYEFVADNLEGKIITITAAHTQDAPCEFVVNNTYQRAQGDLTVAKVFGGALSFDHFPAGIQFTIQGPDDWNGSGLTETTPGSKIYVFTLTKAQPEYTFAKIPVGRYTVTEVVATADKKDYTRLTFYTLDVTDKKTWTQNFEVSGTLTSEGAVVTFGNQYARDKGSLKVKKVVDGYASATQKFHFTVAFDPALSDDVALPGGDGITNAAFSNDRKILTFDMVGGAVATIAGIPTGTAYTVTEDQYQDFITKTEYKNTSKIMTKDSLDMVTVTNTSKTQTLTVTKTVKGVYTGESFAFTIWVDGQVWGNKSYDVDQEERYTSSEGKFRLKDGETAVFTLPQGVSYKVTETENLYYTMEANGNEGMMTSDADATFTNTRKLVGLDVSKTVTGEAGGSYMDADFSFQLYRISVDAKLVYIAGQEYTVWAGGQEVGSGTTDKDGVFTLKHGQTARFADIPADTYTVRELTEKLTLPAEIEMKVASAVVQAITISTETGELDFVNTFTYKKGELKVQKQVVLSDGGTPDVGKTYTFVLEKREGDDWKPVASHKGTEPAVTDISGHFTLTNGQTAHFKNLINGVYRVRETGAPALDGYALETTYEGGDVTAANQATVAAGGTLVTIKAINTYSREMGSLTVAKTVTVTDGAPVFTGKVFTFTLYRGGAVQGNEVTNQSYDIEGGAAGLKTSGNGSFTLTDGQKAVFTGLPTGLYTVVETNAAQAGYTWTVNQSVQDGTVNASTPVALTFANTYHRLTGKLIVAKTVTGDAPDGKTFAFTIQGPVDWTPDPALGLTLEDGDASPKVYGFALAAGGDKDFDNLPGGLYTVTEKDASITDYAWTVSVSGTVTGSNAAVEVPVGGDDATVTYTNRYSRDKASLTINKTFSGIASNLFTDPEFVFEIKGPGIQGTMEVAVGADWNTRVDIPTVTGGSNYYIREKEQAKIDQYTYKDNEFSGDVTGEPDADGWVPFTLGKGAQIEIVCQNNYVKDGAVLKITKAVDGYASRNDTFSFVVEQDGVLLVNQNYSVMKSNGKLVPGTPNTGNDGVVVITAGQTAIITGLETLSTYTVTEVSLDTDRFRFAGAAGRAVYLKADGTDDVGGFDGKITSVGLSISGEMAAKSEGKQPCLDFTFTNERKTGGLTVDKQVEGLAHSEEPFTLFVKFYDGDTMVSAQKMGVTEGGAPVETCYITLRLKHGDEAVIGNIPAGIKYEVEESMLYRYYKADIEPNGKAIEADKTAACTVTNTRLTGKLNVYKVIDPKPADGDKALDLAFGVTVTFTPGVIGTDTVKPNDWVIDDDFKQAYFKTNLDDNQITWDATEGATKIVMKFTLKHGQQLTIGDIPVGTHYKVEETETHDYTDDIADGEGVIDVSGENIGKGDVTEKNVTIFNYDLPEGALVIKKTVKASLDSPLYQKRFLFTLTLTQPGKDGNAGYNAYTVAEQLKKAEGLMDTLRGLYGQAQQAEKDAKALVAITEAEIQKEEKKDGFADILRLKAAWDDLVAAGCLDCENGQVDCETCLGTGEIDDPEDETGDKVDCPDCENGKVKCGTCQGTGEADEDAVSAAEDAYRQAVQDATTVDLDKWLALNEDLRAQTDVLASWSDKLTVLADKMDKLNVVISELESGTNIRFIEEIDSDDFAKIIRDGTGAPVVALDLNGNVKAMRLNPATRHYEEFNLSETEFDGANGTYTFKLAHNEQLRIYDLPAGTKYTITEEEADFEDDYAARGEDFTGCVIRPDKEGRVIDNENRKIQGTVREKDGKRTAEYVHFENTFKEVKARLWVKKVWIPEPEETVTLEVELLCNGSSMTPKRTEILTKTNEWQAVFDNLDYGSGYIYSVKEISPPAGYNKVVITGPVTLGYKHAGINGETIVITITNSIETSPPTTSHRRTTTNSPSPSPSPSDSPTPSDGDEDIPSPSVPIGGPSDTPGPTSEGTDIDIPSPSVPISSGTDLPDTGGLPLSYIGLLGLLFVAGGVLLGKKKKTGS